jgi:Raf kinase inhibitor-like YbhB/YbcL family protein
MRNLRLLALRLLAALVATVAIAGCASGASGPASPPEATPTTEAAVSDAATGTEASAEFAVDSLSFQDGEEMPAEHATGAAGGINASLGLTWRNAPANTQSFAIETYDEHKVADDWVHWLAVDVPGDSLGVEAGASGTKMPAGSRELENGFGDIGWGGPQPPKGTGPHAYRTTVYALDVATVEVDDDASLGEFRDAIEDHVLASASVVGTFER